MIKFIWSRIPGKFLDKTTGTEWKGSSFNGCQHEWNETLIEVLYDIVNNIVRKDPLVDSKTLTFHTSPPVAMIMKTSVLYGFPYGHILVKAASEDQVSNVVEVRNPSGVVHGIVAVLDLP